MTYYFIDDFDDIVRQKDGMDKDFAEVIDLVDLIDDINKLAEENKGFKIDGEFKNKAYSKLLDSFMKLKKKYQGIKKENKELKEILKHTYEIHECETCKHNESFNWLDPATMNREYDSRCSKGLHYDDEVHGCEKYELDLEMFKKRVKR